MDTPTCADHHRRRRRRRHHHHHHDRPHTHRRGGRDRRRRGQWRQSPPTQTYTCPSATHSKVRVVPIHGTFPLCRRATTCDGVGKPSLLVFPCVLRVEEVSSTDHVTIRQLLTNVGRQAALPGQRAPTETPLTMLRRDDVDWTRFYVILVDCSDNPALKGVLDELDFYNPLWRTPHQYARILPGAENVFTHA